MKRTLANLIFIVALSGYPAQAEIIRTFVQSTIYPDLEGNISEVALSSNGSLVAITSYRNNIVKVFSTKAGASDPIATLEAATLRPVSSLAFSPNGQLIAIGNWEGRLRLCQVPSGEQCSVRGFSESITSLRFASDNETIAVGTGDGTVALWNTKTGSTQIAREKGDWPVRRLRFVAEGASLMWATAHSIYRYDLKTLSLETTNASKFPDYAPETWSPSPDGKFFAYSGRTFRLWELSAQPKQVAEVAPKVGGEEEPISGINFFETEPRVTVGYGHRRIAIWDMSDVMSSDVLPVQGMVFDREILMYFTSSANGEILATGDIFGGYVEIWRAKLLPR